LVAVVAQLAVIAGVITVVIPYLVLLLLSVVVPVLLVTLALVLLAEVLAVAAVTEAGLLIEVVLVVLQVKDFLEEPLQIMDKTTQPLAAAAQGRQVKATQVIYKAAQVERVFLQT
jgi:hypothetical protein